LMPLLSLLRFSSAVGLMAIRAIQSILDVAILQGNARLGVEHARDSHDGVLQSRRPHRPQSQEKHPPQREQDQRR
jgi:hypothetical protein